jgi:hypothetical protein
MPDCRNCHRPMRALCDAVEDQIGLEYGQLAARPPADRAALVAEVQVTERLQAQLRNACALKRQQWPPQETQIAGSDPWADHAPPGSTRH